MTLVRFQIPIEPPAEPPAPGPAPGPAAEPPPPGEPPGEQPGEPPAPARPSIGGLLIPWNVPAAPSGPFERVQFAPGSVDVPEEISRVKLLRDHDERVPIGVMTESDDDGTGLSGRFGIGSSPEALEALALAKEGILDGFSVGVEVEETREEPEGIVTVTAGRLVEASLLALPAYEDARVTDIAARRNRETDTMTGQAGHPPDDDIDTRITAAVNAAFAAHTAPAAAAPAVPEPPPAVRTVPRGTELMVDAAGYGRRTPGYLAPDGTRITAGDYFGSYLAGRKTGDYTAFNRVRAALADETTTQVPGLLPKQILEPMLGTVEPIRRVWNSFTTRVAPTIGGVFQRPRITQHVAVDVQAAELGAVASQPMTVVLDDVAKQTIAGALRLSVQAIDWTSPPVLDMVMADFLRVYAARTDTYAATALAAIIADNTGAAGDLASPETVNAALYTAAEKVFRSGDDYQDPMPDTVWMASNVWAALGGMADGDGRPIYPYLGPANTLTIMDPGDLNSESRFGSMNRVVSKKFAPGTFIIGDSSMLEMYEDRRGLLRAEEPAVLGVQIATYGYVASYPIIDAAFQPITLTGLPVLEDVRKDEGRRRSGTQRKDTGQK